MDASRVPTLHPPRLRFFDPRIATALLILGALIFHPGDVRAAKPPVRATPTRRSTDTVSQGSSTTPRTPRPTAVPKEPDAASGAKPSSESNQSRQDFSPVYIEDAVISAVTPSVLSPDAGFSVDLQVTLDRPVPLPDLAGGLTIFVNGQIANPMPSPAEVNLPSEAANTTSETTPSGAAVKASNIDPRKRVLTIFARAPASLPAGQKVVLSVYSRFDDRNIARLEVETVDQINWVGNIWLYVLGMTLAAISVIVAFYVRMLRRGYEKQLTSTRKQLNDAAAAIREGPLEHGPDNTRRVTSPPLEVPDLLISALSTGELTVVLGPEVAAAAGLPTRDALWLALIDRVQGMLPREQSLPLKQALQEAGADALLETLISDLGREPLVKCLIEELSSHPVNLNQVHAKLGQLSRFGLRRYVDLTWDGLLEAVLIPLKGSVFTGLESASLSQAIRGDSITLMKPYGHVSDASSIVLTQHDFRKRLAQAPELERCIAYLFSTQTFLFLGVSTEGIERFLAGLPAELESSGRDHFAILPAGRGTDYWAAGFGKRYGLSVLSVEAPDVSQILDLILNKAPTFAPSALVKQFPQDGLSGKVTSLRLTNIGNFTELNLDFTDSWNLFLGDNGGGKSTILRAITLALAGSDPRGGGMGARLLRNGTQSGLIELALGKVVLRTRLTRDSGRVVVAAPAITPLQAGQAMVLAFPALRGVTTTQSTGPVDLRAAEPSVDDVLPLLQEKVDTRLNQLKQWVINTAIQVENLPRGREAQMFESFGNILRSIVPGRGVAFSHIDRKTWTVWLVTDEGEISFDSLSQGTTSILAWVGILLQRLYDTHPGMTNPEKASALVIIDEIDAHLHPRWQRKLVTLTREQFPNIQMICSSHSPLLAGAVKRNELRVVERDPDTGRVMANLPPEDMSGQKVEDILTSSLFALSTTRSPAAEKKIKEYFALFESRNRDPADEERLRGLENELEQLNYGPSAENRKAYHEIQTVLAASVNAIPDELARSLSARFASKKPVSGDIDESR